MKEFLGIEIHHIVEVDFKGFPKFVDALGGVKMTFGQCIVSRFEGRTVRFRKGEHHLNGQEALDVVRIRKNRCAPEESRPHARPPPAAVPGGGQGPPVQPVQLPALALGRAGGRRRRSCSDMGGAPADGALLRHRDRRQDQAAHPAPDQPGREPAAGLRAEKQAAVQRFLDG